MRITWVVILWIGWQVNGYGQASRQVWEPSATLSLTLSDRHSLTGQLTAFQTTQLLERVEGSVFVNRRVTVRTTLSGGYLLRIGTPLEATQRIEHRPSVTLAHTASVGIRQVSHRVRLEARIRDSGTVYRTRYRLSMRSPLQGERLDPGEYYLLIQQESLGTFSENPFSYENRLSAHVGLLLMNRQRVEVGLQHRAEDIWGGPGMTHTALLSTVWHFTR